MRRSTQAISQSYPGVRGRPVGPPTPWPHPSPSDRVARHDQITISTCWPLGLHRDVSIDFPWLADTAVGLGMKVVPQPKPRKLFLQPHTPPAPLIRVQLPAVCRVFLKIHSAEFVARRHGARRTKGRRRSGPRVAASKVEGTDGLFFILFQTNVQTNPARSQTRLRRRGRLWQPSRHWK